MKRKQDIAEKTLVEDEFAGLQVDTRPPPPSHLNASPPHWQDDFDANQFHFTHEKPLKGQWLDGRALETSPGTAYGTWTNAYGSSTLSPQTPGMAKSADEHLVQPHGRAQRERRICGLKRKLFWVLVTVSMLIIIIAALVGALVGKLTKGGSKASASPPQTSANASLPALFPPAQKADVMLGSPLAVVSYDLGGNDKKPDKRQEFRMYFQSLFGNVKEAVASGSSSWQAARPILTDAINNTGLASYTYLNGTQQQGSIFYVGTNGLLQEKRKIYSDSQYWQVASLNNLNIPMTGNLTPATTNGDPQNAWDSYRFTAVYSSNFSTGAGARLFYHAQQSNGKSFVQEMIWYQANDTWTQGAAIPDANPNSHMTATVDDSAGVLRLFFSTGNRSLQEVWTSTRPGGGKYSKTVRVDNLLAANNADLASVSANGTAHLFHYASAQQGITVGIHELIINGTSKSGARQETFNLTEPLVASPLLPGGTNASLYQPIAASITAVRNLPAQFLVFWVDKPTGDPQTNNTGYQEMSQVSRPSNSNSWPSGTQIEIPLGSEDSDPH